VSASESSPAKVTWRRGALLAIWLLAGAGLLARAVQVQVVEASEWQRVAERQHRRTLEIPAPRGTILDRDGASLAVSHERIRVAVAPGEVRDAERTAGLLGDALGLEPGAARRVVGSTDPWVVLPGRYPPAVRQRIGNVRGIYLERELERTGFDAETVYDITRRIDLNEHKRFQLCVALKVRPIGSFV